MSDTKKLGIASIVLMMFSVVFGFGNPAMAYLQMGYAAIPWYILGAFTFFLPLIFMSSEFAVSLKDDTGGGICTWMNRSRGEFYGFVGSFMWYFAYVIWMTSTSFRIWKAFSSGIFGSDTTETWSFLGLKGQNFLAILGIAVIVTITYLGSRGFNKISTVAKIGGMSCVAINVLMYLTSFIVLLFNKGMFEEPVKGISSFTIPPTADKANFIALVGFMTYAMFAYGGFESLGSIVEKAKSAKTFSKGCLVATAVIAIGYSITIFLWGISSSHKSLSAGDMGNIVFVLMRNLGYKLGLCFGMSEAAALSLGATFMRIMGMSMFLSFTGAFFTLSYAPLKTIIDGAPKKLWPSFMTEKNENGMPQKAMWLQAGVICFLVLIISFGGDSAKGFFGTLQTISNVAMSLPYLFIVAAFPAFRNNESLNHDYKIFKSKTTVYFVSVISFIFILIANLFTIFEPVLLKDPAAPWKDEIWKTSWMLGAPVIFLLIAVLIFNSYKKRVSDDTTNY